MNNIDTMINFSKMDQDASDGTGTIIIDINNKESGWIEKESDSFVHWERGTRVYKYIAETYEVVIWAHITDDESANFSSEAPSASEVIAIGKDSVKGVWQDRILNRDGRSYREQRIIFHVSDYNGPHEALSAAKQWASAALTSAK